MIELTGDACEGSGGVRENGSDGDVVDRAQQGGGEGEARAPAAQAQRGGGGQQAATGRRQGGAWRRPRPARPASSGGGGGGSLAGGAGAGSVSSSRTRPPPPWRTHRPQPPRAYSINRIWASRRSQAPNGNLHHQAQAGRPRGRACPRIVRQQGGGEGEARAPAAQAQRGGGGQQAATGRRQGGAWRRPRPARPASSGGGGGGSLAGGAGAGSVSSSRTRPPPPWRTHRPQPPRAYSINRIWASRRSQAPNGNLHHQAQAGRPRGTRRIPSSGKRPQRRRRRWSMCSLIGGSFPFVGTKFADLSLGGAMALAAPAAALAAAAATEAVPCAVPRGW
ncbi:Protein of unknown function [Gryllus bimaculatus]|nr:Protein of unknown function [Gryllus bimaculatus]